MKKKSIIFLKYKSLFSYSYNENYYKAQTEDKYRIQRVPEFCRLDPFLDNLWNMLEILYAGCEAENNL